MRTRRGATGDNSLQSRSTLPAGYHSNADMLRSIRTHLVRDGIIVLRAIYNPVRVTIKQGPVSADTNATRQMEGRTNHDPRTLLRWEALSDSQIIH